MLLEMGFVDEETLLPFLGSQIRRRRRFGLREGLVDPAVVRLIPRAKAESLCALAMFKVRDMLSVAMAEPRNLQQIDELERITGLSCPAGVWRSGRRSNECCRAATKTTSRSTP